jgi:hypothetical protein
MSLNEINIIDSSFDGIEKAFNILKKGVKVNYITNNEYIFHSLKNGYVKNIERKELIKFLINKEINIKKINECDNFSSIIFITRNMLENNYDEVEALCKNIAEKIKKRTIIIYNGVSFPGNVEEYIEKTLINFSNLEYKKDFHIGYISPQIIDFGKIFLSENKNDELRKILKSIVDFLWPEYEKIYFQYIKDAEAANIFSIILNEINLITYSLIYFLSDYFNFEVKQILEILKVKPRKILDEESYLNIIKNFIFQENKKYYDIKIINHYEKICKNIFEKIINNIENKFKSKDRLFIILDSFRFENSFLQKYKRKRAIILKTSEEILNMNEKEVKNFISNSDIILSYTLNSQISNRILEISKKLRKNFYDMYNLKIEGINNG